MADRWHPQLLQLLAGPHRPTWRVSAHHPDLPNGALPLQLSRLQLSWDETRAPRVQLRCDVAQPADAELDAALDPRAGVRLHVHAGHVVGRGDPVGPTVTRTNLAKNPRAKAGGQGWLSNNTPQWTVTLGTAVGSHPQGITTAARFDPTGTAGQAIGSAYLVDGVVSPGPVRRLGCWVWCSRAARAVTYLHLAQAATSSETAVPASTWTWIETKAAGTGYAVVIVYTSDGATVVPGTDRVLMTGGMASTAPGPLGRWFDGESPGSATNQPGTRYAWSTPGTPLASESVEQLWAQGPELLEEIMVADLALRERAVTDPGGTIALDAAGDESLVIDAAPSSITSTMALDSPRQHIRALIQSVLPAADVVLTAPSTTSLAFAAGEVGDKWAMIEDLADGIGDADVYDDGLRAWRVALRPTLAATPDLELTDGVGGTVVQRSSRITREEWANRVVLVYRWGTSNVVQAVRSITSGPFAATAGNLRTWTEERSMPATQARADAAAASLVKRKASRGRALTVRAVAVPWLRPGMTVRLNLRGGQARHLVSSVLFDGTGWMEFTTRYPDSTETIGT